MSVETVATETATETESVVRTPLSISDLNAMRNNPAIRIADENNPEDETLDTWGVFHTYRENASGYGRGGETWDHGRFRYYPIIESASGHGYEVGTETGEWFDASRIMERFAGSYNDYFQHLTILNSVGKFGRVYYDSLPRELRNLYHWPATSNAYFEVLATNHESKTATVRLFGFPDAEDGDYHELGEHSVVLEYLNRASIMPKDVFDSQYGLSKYVYPEGTIFERIQNGQLCTVTGNSWNNVKLKNTDNDGKVSGRHSAVTLTDLSPTVNRYIKLGDSWNDYLLSQPAGDAAEMLKALSKITVAKALKHADSNNYCSETAVALASAGHSLPELRVKGTITLNVDVSTKEYMVLRRLMGHTEGDADQAVRDMFGNPETGAKPNMELYRLLQREAGGALPDIAGFGNNATFELASELVWKAPRIRK